MIKEDYEVVREIYMMKKLDQVQKGYSNMWQREIERE